MTREPKVMHGAWQFLSLLTLLAAGSSHTLSFPSLQFQEGYQRVLDPGEITCCCLCEYLLISQLL